MTKKHDFIIIGGGPTGSTAAFYLAKNGYSVLVLEKEIFPRQHVGESLLPFCYSLFQEMGVLEEMKKRFVRKPGARFTNCDNSKSSTWCFRNVLRDETYLSFHVVRADFDKMLLDNAKKNGAEVIEGAKVENVILDRPDGMARVIYSHKNNVVELDCKFLIDASGQDTFLGKRLGGKKAYQDLDRVAFLTHWKGAEYIQGIDVGLLQIVYLDSHKGGWFGIQPVGKDRLSVGLIIDRKYLKQEKQKFISSGISDWQKALYLQEVENCALTKSILKKAHIIQELIIVSDYSYFINKTFSNNYAVIGDAAKFLDPIFASGVYLGMNSAKLFAEALDVLFQKGKAEGMQAMKETDKHITGAYNLVEKFINIFYNSASLNLAEVSSMSESSHEKYETAFSLIHYLLAGDFFGRYETYSDFLDVLQDPKQFARWKSLVLSRPNLNEATCGANYNEIFGSIDDELVQSSLNIKNKT